MADHNELALRLRDDTDKLATYGTAAVIARRDGAVASPGARAYSQRPDQTEDQR